MMFKKILPLFLIFSLGVQAQSTSTGVDTMIIGKPGSSGPVKIKSKDGGYLKKDVSGPWIYSNDGLLEKKLGSGSGSGGSTGTNLLANDSFEDGLTPGWTFSGGVFTQTTYPVGTENDLKYARFIANTSGQYVEQIVSVPTSFSAGCQADFKKVNIATAGLFKVQALDVSNNVLAEQTIGVSAWIKVPTISFPCPAAGPNNLKLRLISLAAGTIDFDRGYIGSSQNLVYTSQARLMGTIKISGCAAPFAVSTTSLSDFPAGSGCVYTTTGDALAPTTMIPGIRFSSLPPGDYRVEYEGQLQNTSSGSLGTYAYYGFSDGVNVAKESSQIYAKTAIGATSTGINQQISYATTQSNVTLRIKAAVSDLSTSATVTGTAANSGVIKVWYFPSSSEVAFSNEQSSWFIDANMGGANTSLPIAAVTSYSEVQSTIYDLVLNTQKGSASAEIACASGFPSTGLTCTGGTTTESVGIAFIPPSAGQVYACADFSVSLLESQSLIWQIVETPNNAVTILQEGGERKDTAGVSGTTIPNKVCGIFNFNDISKKTLRLMYEKTATTGQHILIADRSGSAGQRDIHWTVIPITSAFNRPVLTGDQVTTPGGVKIVTKHVLIGTGSCTNTTFYGSPWLSYVSGANIGGGCNYTMAGFSARPICTGMPEQQNAILTNGSVSMTNTNTQFRVLQSSTLANVDTATGITCTGPSN